MKIIVSGKQVDVGETLTNHIETRIENGASKYFERITSFKVVVSKQGRLFRADIHGNTGTHSGVTIKSHAEDNDVYAAFDSAADKVEKQLRRYKRRLTNHHKTRETSNERDVSALQAKKFVLVSDESKDESENDAPVIIAEKTSDIMTLSVADAVMHMDLADLPALMFVNSSTKHFNVVYRRKDGNISWVDPSDSISNNGSKVA